MAPKRKASSNEHDGAARKQPNTMSLLQDAIKKGTLEQFRDVLNDSRPGMPRQDVLAITLSMSCHKGRLEVVEYLLSEGADANAAVKGRPLVPLVQAVEACQAPEGEANSSQQPRAQQRAPRPPDAAMTTQTNAAEQDRLAKLEMERVKQEELRLEKIVQDRQRALRQHAERIAIVRLLLEHRAKPNVRDAKGRTPLMLARTRDVAQLLLDHGADVLAQDNESWTALMHARRLDIVELLLARSADVEARDTHHRTALMITIIEDADPSIALSLISGGASVEAADDMGRTILVTAVWKNRLAVVERLLAEKVNVSRKDDRGRNVYHHYAGDSDRRLEAEDSDGPRIFKLLLTEAEDGDLRLRDSRERTPLHWAAATGNLAAAGALLMLSGTAVDARERKGKTPLHLIVRLAPSLEDVEKTDDYRSDNGSVGGGQTHPNATQRQQESLRRQQKIKEKVKQEEHYRRTELLLRINGLVMLLLQHKADVNAESEGGWTPLHIACREQTVTEIIDKLLAGGANRNQRTHVGKTPFHIACEVGNLRVVQHIITSPQTSVNTKDNFGNSPLLAAASSGHKDVVTLLTPWSKRQIDDLSKDAKGAAEQFYATVVDFGGYKRGNEVKKVRVYDLLYTDPAGASKTTSSTVCEPEGSTVFRWIHLPANNVSWCQDLLTRRFVQEGAEDGQSFKTLQRSFLHQHGGSKWHSNYMRPGCQALPRSKKAVSPAQGTAPRLSVSLPPQSPASSQYSDDGVAPDITRVPLQDLGSTERSQIQRTNSTASAVAGALTVPDDSTADSQRQHRPRAVSFSHDPPTEHAPPSPLRSDTFTSTASRGRSEPSRHIVVTEVIPSRDHNVFLFSPYLHFETDNQRQEMQAVAKRATGDLEGKQVRFDSGHPIQQTTPDELLIKAFLNPPISNLHPRRTLDQSFYRTIDTDFRDRTQVVYRYAKKHGSSQEPLKVLMVDQLWMWIVGKDLVVTSFPQRWRQPREDPLNVLESTVSYRVSLRT